MDNKPTKSFNNLQFTQFARDLGFTISSDKEVNDPNPEFIQNLLLECLVRCSDFKLEQLKNIAFQTAIDMTSLEKHEAGISFITIFQRIQALVNTLGIEDFSINDMLFPEAKRIKRIFAELAGFMGYRNQEIKHFESFFEANNELEVKLKKVEEEYKGKKTEFDNLVEKKKSEKEAFDSKEVEIEQLNKELKREIEENNEMKSFSIEIHDKINEIDKTILKIEEEISNIKKEASNLKFELVFSPEKLTKKKLEITEDITKEKEILDIKETDLLIKNFILKILQAFHTKLTKECSKFKELSSNLDTESHYKKEFTDRKLALAQTKTKNEIATTEANELIWNLKNLEEKSRRLDSDLKRSLEHMTLSLQKLREERRKEEVKDRDLAEQLTITNQKLQEITKKINLTKTQSEFFYKKEEKFYLNLKNMLVSLKTRSLALFDKF